MATSTLLLFSPPIPGGMNKYCTFAVVDREDEEIYLKQPYLRTWKLKVELDAALGTGLVPEQLQGACYNPLSTPRRDRPGTGERMGGTQRGPPHVRVIVTP